MSLIVIILILLVAFLAGTEGVLDQFQFHQPIVACTLIGLVTGHLKEGIMLGGALQMIALGWSNVGAAIAPDAALASTASSVLLVLALKSGTVDIQNAINTAIAAAIPLSVAGLFLTMLARTISISIVHLMDKEAEKGNFKGIEILHIIAICIQGLRVAIPVAILLFISPEVVKTLLESMPAWLSGGMAVGGGMVAAVGYAMVLNMMASKEVWPFFVIGFALAAVNELTLIALGAIGVSLALIYIGLKESAKSNGNSGGDPLGDILNDY